MKNLQVLCIALAVMLCLVNCDVDTGVNSFVTTSNSDPGSCNLTLVYQIKTDRIKFTATQSYQPPPTQDCTHQNIKTASLFYNEPFTPVTIVLTPTAANPRILKGEFLFSQAKSWLGKSCAYAGEYGPSQDAFWFCKFKYSSIFFYLDLYLKKPLNTTFDTNWTKIMYPDASTKTVGGLVLPNNAFPHLIGRLNDPCGANSWNNVITNYSHNVVVLGTEYLSNTKDLHKWLNHQHLWAILVHSHDQPVAVYRTVKYQTVALYPFDVPSNGNCSNIGVKYSALIPNANYCKNGCAITLIFFYSAADTAYALTTNGVKSA